MKRYALIALSGLLSACAGVGVEPEGQELGPAGQARALLGEWQLSAEPTGSEVGTLVVDLEADGRLRGEYRPHGATDSALLRVGFSPAGFFGVSSNPACVIRLASWSAEDQSDAETDLRLGSVSLRGRRRSVLARRTSVRCGTCGRRGEPGAGSRNQVDLGGFRPSDWDLEAGALEQEIQREIRPHLGHDVALTAVRLGRIRSSRVSSFLLWVVLGLPVAWLHEERYELTCELSLDQGPPEPLQLELSLNYFERNPSSGDLALLLATAFVFPTPVVCTDESAVARIAFRELGQRVARRLRSEKPFGPVASPSPLEAAPSDAELLCVSPGFQPAPLALDRSESE